MSAEKEPIEGRAWVFGDNIDTDQLAPVPSYMNKEPEEGCKMCLQAVDPESPASAKATSSSPAITSVSARPGNRRRNI